MLGLALKKSLLDLWEHAAVVVTANVFLSASGFGLFLLVDAAATRSLGFGTISLSAALVVFAALLGVAAGVAELLCNRNVPDWQALSNAVRCCAGPAAMAASTVLGLFSLILFVLPSEPGAATVMAHVIFAWIMLVAAEVFLFQLAATPHLGAGRALRGAIRLTFERPGFSAAILLISALFFFTSVIFFPGPVGAFYFARIAVVWHLQADKTDLARESRMLGRRGLLDTLFPWKG